jgi:futalosine hydrolase
MQILVVAATEFELNAVKKCLVNTAEVDFVVTGVGMLPTAYILTRLLLQKKYDWVFDVGIAGTFSEQIALGEAVVIVRESVDGSGIEAADESIKLFPNDIACTYVDDLACLQEVQRVSGLTVNLLTENPLRVMQRKELYGAEVETMEGAAFFYVCKKEGVKFLQLRGISNRVGERDKAKWKTAEAMESVGDLLEKSVSCIM